MYSSTLILVSLFTITAASLFDFIQNHFHEDPQNEAKRKSPLEYENNFLNTPCDGYLCPDTKICVEASKFCPCPYPSSQLRCFLPDGQYICISKPAGDISMKYDDPKTNWKVDAKDDNIRDCGWVNRAWKNLL